MAKPASDRGVALPALCVGAMLVFALVLLALGAARLPFWYDESLTVRLSRLDSVADLWRAVTAGFEFTPPLIYVATKATRLLPGPETLTARIPGLAGFVLLSVFLFIFLERRLGAWFASAAVLLLPLADYTVRYAIEARAYMLLLGVSAIALVCWQSTVDRRSRLAPSGAGLFRRSGIAASRLGDSAPARADGRRGGRVPAHSSTPVACHRSTHRRGPGTWCVPNPAPRVEDRDLWRAGLRAHA